MSVSECDNTCAIELEYGRSNCSIRGMGLERTSGMDEIRQAEWRSIRNFVEGASAFLRGRVLDFGAGKPGTCLSPEPYRAIVESRSRVTEYCPYDKGDDFKPPYDSILCTQVLHLVGPKWCLDLLRQQVEPGANLVLTYPTNWDFVEDDDLWRYTPSGIDSLFQQTGWRRRTPHALRAVVKIGHFRFPLGYGVVAEAVDLPRP